MKTRRKSKNPSTKEIATAYRRLTTHQRNCLLEICESGRHPPNDIVKDTTPLVSPATTTAGVETKAVIPKRFMADEKVLQETSHGPEGSETRRLLLTRLIHELASEFDMDIAVLFASRQKQDNHIMTFPITSSGTPVLVAIDADVLPDLRIATANHAIWSLDCVQSFKDKCKGIPCLYVLHRYFIDRFSFTSHQLFSEQALRLSSYANRKGPSVATASRRR